MGKISPKRRSFEIRKKQKRRKKIMKLKDLYFKAQDKKEKEKILEKIIKLAPHISLKQLEINEKEA
jgi:uncharacterized protein (DUF1919 family)